jgi:hypothetical protein
MGNNGKNFIEYLQLPIRIILVFYLILKSIKYCASGGQGRFLKKLPLHPAKTFY